MPATNHGLRIAAILLERTATVFLAILLLRLHSQMANIHRNTFHKQSEFLQKWVVKEKYYTIITVSMLVIALVLSLLAEILDINNETN